LKKIIVPLSIVLILIIISLGLIYSILLSPHKIDCGIVLDRNETSTEVNLKLGNNDKTRWIKIAKDLEVPGALAYNVVLRGKKVVSISSCKTYTGKVLSRTDKTLEIENNLLSMNSNVMYYKIDNGELIKLSPNSVIVGYDTYRVITDKGGKVSAVMVDTPKVENVRVGISTFDFSSLNHSTLTFYSKRGLEVRIGDTSSKLDKSDALKVDYQSNKMTLSVYTKKDQELIKKSELGQTTSRVYINSLSENPISVTTLTRGKDFIPSYYGSFEIFIKDNSMRLINEVNIEDYLRFVVPSEMLSIGGAEGYRVQSVAARTYTISEMLSGRFAKSGFHLIDTTLSQVYNAQPFNSLSETAIEDTKGQILTYKNLVIDAKYYSTSSGVGAPFDEMWSNNSDAANNNPEPYLDFKDYTETGIKDLSKESDASQFYKDWTVKAYDSNSPYFRWKFSMDKKTLNTVVNQNIYDRFNKSPDSFKKKWHFNIYRKTLIPKEGIGDINEIYISKRGKSGIIMEMTIVSDKGTFKVDKESNIRNILTPRGIEYEIKRIYGTPLKNPSAIPSSFFTIDTLMSGSKMKDVTIYGGGFGHGVGMSQYGVIGLVRKGKPYTEILKVFYDEVDIKNYKDIIELSIK
jgi:stage II sporulation protein D